MFSFVETRLFTRLVQECLSDDEYSQLQQVIIADPEIGAIIPRSGGVRKMHWAVAGRGKRGGIRVIYFLRTQHGQVWMLTLYAKNVAENIPAHVLKQIKDEIGRRAPSGVARTLLMVAAKNPRALLEVA